MPFRDIDTTSLRDFVLNERRDASLWLFMHIPKTAGSSLSEAMQELMSPYRNIQIDYSNENLSHNKKLDISTEQFIADFGEKQYRSASGHVPYDLVNKIRKSIPKTKIVTFLRDPVSRVVSDYRYQRTPQHPPYESFKKKFPTLESYIDSVESQNKIARFVGGRGVNLSSIDLKERLDNDFSFVGLLEMYPLSYNIMFHLFGSAGQFPKVHARKTPDNSDTKVEVTEKIIQMIKDNNKLDSDIYSHVKIKLTAARETWQEYLKSGFPEEWQEQNEIKAPS